MKKKSLKRVPSETTQKLFFLSEMSPEIVQ